MLSKQQLKKNRPQLSYGSVIYARVIVANKDMEPELVCYATNNKAEVFGELNSGYIFKTSLSLSRSLLSNKSPILTCLGKKIAYEIAVGMNGRVWINSTHTTNIILLSNAILNSEHLPASKIEEMVIKLLERAEL